MGLVILSPACGFAKINPVGRLVTDALETFCVHKGLQEVDRVLIKPLPVIFKPPGHPTQDMGSQVRHPDPGQNQEAALIGNQVDILSAYTGCPTDKAVPAADMARCRGKGYTGHRSSKGKDQILEVLPYRLAISQVVILLDETVKEFLGCRSPHLPDLQGQYPGKRPFKGDLINGYFGGFFSVGQGIGRILLLCRQPDMTGPVKLKH